MAEKAKRISLEKVRRETGNSGVRRRRRRRVPDGVGRFRADHYLTFKTAAEFVIALLLLIPGIPLMLFAALAIKITSRGPAFYSQVRVGRHGRPFTIYKIRSMVNNCEKVSGPRWSTPGDPRITGVGRLLRKTHLDELPQLFNVLKGDMGLIGPRPERPEFVEDLQQEFPTYPDRLLVRPGVTGLAQVQLPADTGLVSVRRKLTYDIYYIRNLNAWLDVRILFATVFKAAGVPYRLVRQLSALPGSHIISRAVRPRRVRPSLDDRAQWAA
jgi:lipopolysaccharide/colanic/teichoic acid biosynthesis glycosyltransferase